MLKSVVYASRLGRMLGPVNEFAGKILLVLAQSDETAVGVYEAVVSCSFPLSGCRRVLHCFWAGMR